MGYATLWLIGFGVLFTSYLVTAGFDYGVGVLLPVVARNDKERRLGLNAIGPFLLGNEVWLLVAIGILIGTLPGLESRLLDGGYPLAVLAAVGAILTVVCVQLRSRSGNPALRRFWDALIFAGGLCAAFGWGALIGVLAAGVDLGPDGRVLGAAGALSVFPVLSGLTMVAVLGAHGAMFLTGRANGMVSIRAARAARWLIPAAATLLVLTVLVGWPGGALSGSFARPTVALVLIVLALAALGIAAWRLNLERPWEAFAATAAAVALLPVSVFAAKYPALITSHTPGAPTPTLAELADTQTALAMITWTAGPIMLIVIAVQAYGWWVFRGKLTRESVMFY